MKKKHKIMNIIAKYKINGRSLCCHVLNSSYSFVLRFDLSLDALHIFTAVGMQLEESADGVNCPLLGAVVAAALQAPVERDALIFAVQKLFVLASGNVRAKEIVLPEEVSTGAEVSGRHRGVFLVFF